MTKHDPGFYLEGVLEHIDAIERYKPGSRQEFDDNMITQDAILMRLVAIGEEIGRLRHEFPEDYEALHWHQVIGLRNVIAHGYSVVDRDTIWNIIDGGPLKELKQAVQNKLD